MPDQTNPQIEKTLDELADLVCQSLQGKNDDFVGRRDQLLKTLVMSGFVWKADRSVMQRVEHRVKDQCREPSMHRGGALSSITSELETRLADVARWESKTPADSKSAAEQSPSKAANLSSSTDA